MMFTDSLRALVKISLAAAILLNASLAMGQVLFSDDFQSGLGQWTGKSEGAHHGIIVTDPLDGTGTNKVLTFTLLNAAGDIFGTEKAVTPGTKYLLRFDYLGLATVGSVAGDLGGYAGFSDETPGTHRWLIATGIVSGAQDLLVDDGQWDSYYFEFDPAGTVGADNMIRVMLEDFNGSGGVPGDAYFDNIVLEVDLEPDAVDDEAMTFTNTPIDALDVLSNDDLGNEPVTVTIDVGPTSGTAVVDTSDNTIDYTPNAGFGGVDTFDYKITDVDGDTDTATVTVTVDPSKAAINSGQGVTVLNCADDPDCDNPFDWLYQDVDGDGATLFTECCAAPAVREIEGTGRGRRLWYNARDLDVGQLLKDTPACANVVELLETEGGIDFGNPEAEDYSPIAVLRPWQRVYPDPDQIQSEAAIEDLYGDREALALQRFAFCGTVSTANVNGVALMAENPFTVLDADPDIDGYEVECTDTPALPQELRLAFRPLTEGISLDLQEQDFPFFRPWTAECDGSRSVKRSSVLVSALNVRNDTDQNGPKSTVSRLLSDLYDEIVNERENTILSAEPDAPAHLAELAALETKWLEAKDAVNDGLQAVKKGGEPLDEFQPAVNRLDEFTCLALTLANDPLGTNPSGLLGGRAINARFMTCSYLQHGDTLFDGGEVTNSCFINSDVEDTIRGVAGAVCPTVIPDAP